VIGCDGQSVRGNVGCSTIVVGLGNDIACDDGAGIVFARRLKELIGPLKNVQIVELPWAGLRLLDVLSGHQRAILVDSLQSGRVPVGSVVRLREDDLAGAVRFLSYHDLNYPTVLSLAKRLGYSMPADVYLLGVEGQRFDRFGITLSPSVNQGIDRAVEIVHRLIRRWHAKSDRVIEEPVYEN